MEVAAHDIIPYNIDKYSSGKATIRIVIFNSCLFASLGR
jgi:hypothetical protein